MRLQSALLAVALNTALAQSPTATLTGRVDDLSGAVVPGVRITIRNINTSESRAVETDQNGEYTVTNLFPGQYEVRGEKAGFQSVHETGLELQVDQVARLDLRLQVGNVSETVEVKAEAPLLNTENPVKGEVIVNDEIMEMPLEDRDFGDLAFLVPGVQRRAQGGTASRFNVNGARADNTNFLVDGIHDQNTRGGGIQVRPPVGAMQEFKMQTTGYPAEYGRMAGGVMNMVLKTGGNRPHGNLFEFLRNDKFDARGFFAADRQKLRRNQFGGSLDGPVRIPKLYDGRNRSFFLVSYEGYRQVIGQIRRGLVPTQLERQGDFSESRNAQGALIPLKDPLVKGACTGQDPSACFPGNRIPASRFSPAALKIIRLYPLPNLVGEKNNLYVSANDGDRWDTWLVKIDHRFTDSDSVAFRYLARQNNLSAPFDGGGLGTFGSSVDERQSLFGLTYTRVFTPALVNEFRMGYTRTAHWEPGSTLGRDYAAEFGISGVTTDPKIMGIPRFTIRDLLPIGDKEDVPIQFTVNNFQWADTLTWVRQRHLVRAGADIVRSQFFQVANNKNRGLFNFLDRWTNQPFGDFLLGLPNSTSRQIGTTPSYMFTNNYGFYLQDDYRLRSNLTINIGLRYELLKPPVEKYGRLGSFIPEYGQFILSDDRAVPDLTEKIAFAGLQGKVGVARDRNLPPTLIGTRTRDFAPRFGFAWRPGRFQRSVVRGGYGIFFGGNRQDNLRSDLAVVFPFSMLQTFNRQANNINFITLAAPFPDQRGTIEGVNNTFAYDLHAPTSYLQSWNLTIEQQAGRETVIEAAYVGSKGTHLGRRYNVNQPIRRLELRLPNGNFPRPFSGFNDITYYSFGANSSYNAGMLSVRRRFTRGFFYRVNYVYSKSIDDASQLAGAGDGGYAGAQDARNLKLERGRSDWDNGHAVTMSFSYDLPLGRRRPARGWQVSGTARMYTGQPFTPKTSNVDLNLGEANRPDRIAKGRLEDPTPERWFDLSAFPVVPVGAYRMGSSGRNILDGPGSVSVNVSLARRFQVGERANAQFRCEAFNVLNHANLDLPNVNVNAVNGGVITGAAPARVLQFGLRYQF